MKKIISGIIAVMITVTALAEGLLFSSAGSTAYAQEPLGAEAIAPGEINSLEEEDFIEVEDEFEDSEVVISVEDDEEAIADTSNEGATGEDVVNADVTSFDTAGDISDEFELTDFPQGFEGMVDDSAATFLGDYSKEQLAGAGLRGTSTDVALDFSGTYFTLSANTILGQINKIRKEACDQGIKYGGRKLTPEDYRPLKWSYALEQATRIRAMQAAITIAHETLGSDDIWDYADYYLTEGRWYGMGENLAWNNEHDASGITFGINQFYAEKYDYVHNTGGVTGHYVNLINPNFTHVGVASCMMSGTPYGWNTIAMQLGKAEDSTVIDETKDNKTGKDTKSLAVATGNITSLSISGVNSLAVGNSKKCSGKAGFRCFNSYGVYSGTYPVSNSEKYPLGWSSSDETVATVNNAVITGVGSGKATITATAGSKSAEIKVSVYELFDSVSLRLSKSSLGLYAGESYKLSTTITPEDIMEKDSSLKLSFSSDNEAVATVDSTGKVTANAEGEAVITARLYSADKPAKYKEASCAVTVSKITMTDTPYEGDDVDGIWVAAQSFDENLEYTGKKLTQANLRVYFKKTLLKEKTDYTVAYKNNTNAAGKDSAAAPQLTITLKGQYSGKKTYYFNINPIDLQDVRIKVPGNVTVNRSNKPQKIVPEIYFDGKKLKAGTDFEAEETMFSEVKATDVKVSGKGNFAGTRVVTVAVSDPDKNLCKAKVSLTKKKVLFDGTAVDLAKADFAVKLGSKVVDISLFEMVLEEQKAGTIKVNIVPSAAALLEGYNGFKSVNVKVSGDRNMKDVVESGALEVIFDKKQAQSGKGMTLPELSLSYNSEKLVEGKDYVLTYSKNTKAGKGAVAVTGLGRYEGSKKISFTILPNDGTEKGFELTPVYKDTVAFEKGGVQPIIRLRDKNGLYLDKGTDYTISVTKGSNQKPGTMTCQVIGKGNYKGYSSDILSINIKNGDLSGAIITADDKAYSTSKTAWKSSVKITDINGKALKAGTDYSSKLEYYYDGMSDNTVPEVGTVVYVTAIGAGSYEGSYITGSYKIYTNSISKLTITVDKMTYTGTDIEPTYANIHIYASSSDAKKQINELTPASDYVKITGYSSNLKPGKGKITLRGIGNYGGSKEITFEIAKKSF